MRAPRHVARAVQEIRENSRGRGFSPRPRFHSIIAKRPTMRVTVSKSQLIDRILHFAQEARTSYSDASIEWHRRFTEVSLKLHQLASDRELLALDDELSSTPDLFHERDVNPVDTLQTLLRNMPDNSAGEKYDNVVEKLKAHTAPTIELDDDEFEIYWNNKWHWARTANALNNSYIAR